MDPLRNFTEGEIPSQDKLNSIERIKNWQLEKLKNTNIGLRKDDLFKILIFKNQDHADFMRNNQVKFEDHYASENSNQLKIDTEYFYVATQNPGILNLYSSSTNDLPELESMSLMEKHKISQKVIYLSIDEVFRGNSYLLFIWKLGKPFNMIIDPSVVIVNQIMFTFYR